MLVLLSVKDLLLIDSLELDLRPNLCALTGETGAGKSILLDSLGLVLGARAETTLIRPGADRAIVTAEFDLPDSHPAVLEIQENGLRVESTLVLRRTIYRDGKNRAFINDQPVSAGLLKQIGGLLVEVQGQHDSRGLLDVHTHINFLDHYANSEKQVKDVRVAWEELSKLNLDIDNAEAEAVRDTNEEDYYRYSLNELELIDPKADKESDLVNQRINLRSAEKIGEAFDLANEILSGKEGPAQKLAAAERVIARELSSVGERLDPLVEGFSRASVEIGEVELLLTSLQKDMKADPQRLEEVEQRLFSLRGLARKHNVTVDQLPSLLTDFDNKIKKIESRSQDITSLKMEAENARNKYLKIAKKLSDIRVRAALKLDEEIKEELIQLKLEKSTFTTVVSPILKSEWGRHGKDNVFFEVRTNKGQESGPLHKVASGGELGRYLLALRVVLTKGIQAPILVFDEVDRGIGGATADAVGERLARLGASGQVLVVTHSPQVAARASNHWRIEKYESGESSLTRIIELNYEDRCEEVARMISGATITDEARAAASKLMSGLEHR